MPSATPPAPPAPVAAITGAGSGIGQATAVMLARRGYRLVIMGRTREALTQTAALCEGAGVEVDRGSRVEVVGGDVTDPFQCKHLIDRCIERFGRLDALINNAGVAFDAPITGHTPDMIRATLAVNVQGPACLIAEAFRHWTRVHTPRPTAPPSTQVALPGPAVINISSIAALDPFPGFFIYAASKAALDMMTRMAHAQGAAIGGGVRVFSINPGAVETPMLRGAFDESMVPASTTLAPASVAEVIAGCILGRYDPWAGGAIAVLPESARDWWTKYAAAQHTHPTNPGGPAHARAIFPEEP